MKRVVPLHDDLFDFFYEALPGYEQVGERRILLGCWGSLNDPDHCDFTLRDMTDWGRKMFVTPGVVVDGKLVTNDLVEINLGIRILLGHSFYEDWGVGPRGVRRPTTRSATPSTAATRGTSTRSRSRASATSTTSTLDDVAALVRRHGPPGAGHRRRPDRAAVGDGAGAASWTRGYVKATGHSVVINLPDGLSPRSPSSGRSRSGPTRSSATAPAPTSRPTPPRWPCTSCEKALAEVRAGHTETWTPFEVPDEAVSVRLHRGRARRAVPPHGDPRGQDRELPPVPADPVERQRPRQLRHAGSLRGRRAEHADLRGEPARRFKGIDIMRAVRSFDPCLPCGVHMYTGGGRVVEQLHTPHDAGQALLTGRSATMHELALTRSVVDLVAERTAGGRSSASSCGSAGAPGWSPDAMRFCFDLVGRAPLEGAGWRSTRCRAAGVPHCGAESACRTWSCSARAAAPTSRSSRARSCGSSVELEEATCA